MYNMAYVTSLVKIDNNSISNENNHKPVTKTMDY